MKSDGTFVSWLAFYGNKMIGTSGMSFVEKTPYFGCPSGKIGLLSSMFKNPDYRRRGIAKELLSRVVNDAKEYGCGAVQITASDMGVACRYMKKIRKKALLVLGILIGSVIVYKCFISGHSMPILGDASILEYRTIELGDTMQSILIRGVIWKNRCRPNGERFYYNDRTMEEGVYEMMLEKRHQAEDGSIVYWVNENDNQTYALVFLHGLTADHTMFGRQISHFEKNFKILCWDAPLHGKSRPYMNFSYKKAVEQLKDILEEEQIKKAVFIGQSLGGYFAQTFIKYYADFVIGFVGIDTTPFGTDYYSKMDQWWLRQVEWMSHCYPYSALIQVLAKSCTYTQYGYENMLASLKQYTKSELCHLMGVGYEGFLEENSDINMKCPALLLVGEYDITGKVKQYCWKWHKKKNIPICIIKKAAHNSNVDNYIQVNDEIEKFLKGISRC